MTIEQAQQLYYGRPGRALEKRIRYHNEQHGTNFGTSKQDLFTPSMAQALGLPQDVPTSQTSKPKAKPAGPSQRPNDQPSQRPKKARRSPSKPRTKADPQDAVFSSPVIFMTATGFMALADGYAYSLIAHRLTGSADIVGLSAYFLVGVVVAYAGLKNAWDLLRRPRKYSTDPTGVNGWITIFAGYQILLHSLAFEFWGSYNDLLGKVVLSAGIGLSMAALSATLFKVPKQETDERNP